MSPNLTKDPDDDAGPQGLYANPTDRASVPRPHKDDLQLKFRAPLNLSDVAVTADP